STCIQLLQQFYRPTTGHIFIDNLSIDKYNLQWYRQQLAIVSQEAVLFSTTIKKNLLYGTTDPKNVTQNEIEEICKDVNIHHFIMKLPFGYDTVIDQNFLSGGQKQLICLARALLKRPKILLLDEFTSALDNENESLLQELLAQKAVTKDRTTIIISHRLSSIRNANNIIVLDHGTLIEQGNHQSLMDTHGIYYDLIQQQQQDFDCLPSNNNDVESSSINQRNSQNLNSVFSPLFEILNNNNKPRQNYKETHLPFLAVLKMNKPEWLYILFGCFVCLINGGLQPTHGVIISKLIFNFLFACSGENLTERLRSKLFEIYLKQDLAWFDHPTNNVGALCTRLANETTVIQAACIFTFLLRSERIIMCVGILISLLYSWEVTLVLFGFLPFIIGAGCLDIKLFNDDCLKKDNKVLEEISKIRTEVTENIRTVKQLTSEEHFYQNYCSLLDSLYKSARNRSHLKGLQFGFTNAIIFFAQAVLVAFSAFMIKRNRMTFEDSLVSPDYGKAMNASKQMLKLFNRQPVIDQSSINGDIIDNFNGEIVFDIKNFSYPSRPQMKILDNFQLKISPGQKVALLGKNGCGKSTVIQLLERFYDSNAGSVFIDSVDIRNINLQWLRSKICYISQQPVLFDGTIEENIAYGDLTRTIDRQEIIDAAKQSNAHKFIEKLPQ
ncbi:unnamed protein product, partial [Didymodactylos carnosus]